MKTEKTDNPNPPKPRGYRFWLTRLTLLLGLPLLLYYGYCWGWWGRGSLLLQYLFQCSCPAISAEARYPEYIDVVVPACKYLESLHSPSGRLIYVLAEGSGTTSTYLLNLETGERTLLTLPDEGSNYFLTDDLIFNAYHRGDEYIFDLFNKIKYPIQRFGNRRPEAYIDGKLNLDFLIAELRGTEDVFLIGDDSIVVFVNGFPERPEDNFIILRSDFPGREADRIEDFLKQNNIIYRYVPDRYPSELISPDGKFVARADGIYLVASGQKIVEGYSGSATFLSGKYFAVRGWTYDGSGVFYSKSIIHWPCLIEGPTLADVPLCIFKVPQPLLILKVPEE